MEAGDVEAASAAIEEDLDVDRRRVAEYGHADPQALTDLAGSLQSVAATRRSLGRLDEAAAAEKELGEVLRLIEERG